MDAMNDVWFADGLRFKCTGCGKCCTGSPGYVFLSPQDLSRLAKHFNLSDEEFTQRYTRTIDGQLALQDQNEGGDCVFLKDKQCTVYDARPIQCKTFPWWIHHLRDPEDWKDAGARCEGIDHPDAPRIDALHIQEQCVSYLDNLIEQNFSL